MTKPEDLVTINDGVLADQTMREWNQLLRVDIDKTDVKAQILLTRKHLLNAKLSKNVAYVSYSLPSSLFALGRLCFAAGMTLMFHGDRSVDLSHAVKWQMKGQDREIMKLIQMYLEGLR